MKQYGSWTEVVGLVFRSDSQAITFRPHQATTYTASRDIQLPPGDAAHVLVSADSTQTLTNKTLTSPVINSPTGITKSDVGLSNVDNTSDATKNAAAVTLTNKTLTSPVINTPTGIVKGDVGLGNVDNTSDATKNAAAVTLTNKTLTTPVINSPTGLVKADVGLGNVDNTSDATKNSASVTLTNKTLTSPVIGTDAQFSNQATAKFFEQTGNGTNFVGLQAPNAIGSDLTFKLPATDGVSGQVLITDGSKNLSFGTPSSSQDSPLSLTNYTIVATVGSSALTIALKNKAGSNPSGGDSVNIAFRNATAATGDYAVVSATAATSLVISSGSTLGHTSAVPTYIYVYALNNAGTIELAASTKRFDDGSIQSTTAEGGAGAADSATVMYSTTTRSNVAVRLIARLSSTQTTAGTWASVPTEISLGASFVTDLFKGTVSGLSVPAGQVGEYIRAQSDLGTTNLTNGQWIDVLNITLTAGDWDIYATAGLSGNPGTFSGVGVAVTSTSGNSTTGMIDGDNRIYSTVTSTSVFSHTVSLSPFRVSITATTTYYLKINSSFNNAQAGSGRLSARRAA